MNFIMTETPKRVIAWDKDTRSSGVVSQHLCSYRNHPDVRIIYDGLLIIFPSLIILFSCCIWRKPCGNKPLVVQMSKYLRDVHLDFFEEINDRPCRNFPVLQIDWFLPVSLRTIDLWLCVIPGGTFKSQSIWYAVVFWSCIGIVNCF